MPNNLRDGRKTKNKTKQNKKKQRLLDDFKETDNCLSSNSADDDDDSGHGKLYALFLRHYMEMPRE